MSARLASEAFAMKSDLQVKTDPVCGMAASRHSEFRAEAAGREFYFCSDGCRAQFEAEPQSFMAPDAGEGVRVPARPGADRVERSRAAADEATGRQGIEGEQKHHIPAWAVHESHVQRMQRGSHQDEGPHEGPPDAYGEEAMALDEPPDELVRRAPPDDTVLGG